MFQKNETKEWNKWIKTKECFNYIKTLIKIQRQTSSLKNRCACSNCIKEGSFHTFKTIGDIFYLKEDMTCESRDLGYVLICSIFYERYIGQTGEGKTRAQDGLRDYRQHNCQPQY